MELRAWAAASLSLSLSDQPISLQCPGPDIVSPSQQHGEDVSPAASELAMVLTHGLSLEHQKSSRDSLHFSSGYSTQTTTPSCSEDAIPSQGRRPASGGAGAWLGRGDGTRHAEGLSEPLERIQARRLMARVGHLWQIPHS